MSPELNVARLDASSATYQEILRYVRVLRVRAYEGFVCTLDHDKLAALRGEVLVLERIEEGLTGQTPIRLTAGLG